MPDGLLAFNPGSSTKPQGSADVQTSTPVAERRYGFGQVEKYMTDIVDGMRAELRAILGASVESYSHTPRDQWLFEWPSQIILVVNQIFWCQEVEAAFLSLSRGKANALQASIPFFCYGFWLSLETAQ
jgi:hypothetical protein